MEHLEHRILGRGELIDLPELGFKNIEVKVDTGAYTSSIHCSFIELEVDNVHCIFLDPQYPQYTGKRHLFEIQKKVNVKSSNGIEEERVVIITEIDLLGEIFSIRLTLSDRSNMKYPILIGRRFLKKKFLVDI